MSNSKAGCGLALFELVVVAPLMLLYTGWVLCVAWGWFAASLYALSYAEAVGITFAVALLTQETKTEGITVSGWVERLVQRVLIPIAFLAIAFIANLYL